MTALFSRIGRWRHLLVAGATALPMAAHAQVTEIARTPIADAAQLTFGHLCEDRFVIRNDGTAPVSLAYSVAKSDQQTSFTLGAREILELSSTSRQALELWKDGRKIARAEKERRKCKDIQGTAAVQVADLQVATRQRPTTPWPWYGAGFGWGAGPWFDPWWGSAYGPWGGWGVRPWGAGVVGVPVIVGRGGRRGR